MLTKQQQQKQTTDVLYVMVVVKNCALHQFYLDRMPFF